MSVVVRNTESLAVERYRTNTATVVAFKPDRATAAALTAATVEVFLGGTLLVERVAATSVAADTATYDLLQTVIDGKDWQPVLFVWYLTDDTTDVTTVLQDGWLVRYFPSPTLVDQDLLDYNPDLLVMSGLSNFSTFHKRAWSKVQRRLFRLGKRIELVLTPSQLWDVEFHQTMMLISGYFWQTMGDERWRIERKEQKAMLREAWGEALMQYDLDEDGRPDETWSQPMENLIRVARAREGGSLMDHY